MSYRFYIERKDGSRSEWTRLSRAEAIKMNRLMDHCTDDTVVRYGWDDMP